MKKQIVKKIISTTIVFLFAIFFLQILSPIVTSAANELNWENPNKNGRNPYKFKPQDALNSQLIMQVVGCTGVVDKVSAAITGLFQKKMKEKIRTTKVNMIRKICEAQKKGGVVASQTIPNVDITEALINIINCGVVQNTKDDDLLASMIESTEKQISTSKREECFNGIAITLARNQLTAMTRYTVNWVNSGFNGDPMYVRNITSLTNSMERNVLETGIDILSNKTRKAFPYGSDFSRSLVTSYRTGGIKYGATNFLDSLASDLGSFVTDPRSYYSEENLDETPFERSTRVNYAFSNDFATGGWNGWLGLTQRDQNNPLGFTMLASQYLADQEQQKIEETKQELLTNQGFLSQKRCVLWEVFEKENVQKFDSKGDVVFNKTKTSKFDKCWRYETVTPGSLIKDKVSTYLNSPERQLEVADTINESLNSLFTALIARFQNQGLSSLSSEDYTFSDPNMGTGYGSNSLDSIDMFGESTSSGYTNGSFDLTRDLGNRYIHNYSTTKSNMGNWNASINTITKNNFRSSMTELNIGTSPTKIGADGELIPLTNVYYVVTTAGATKLFEDGYNGWALGDRAFWNGSEWQNWKKGTANPIKERGIIQIQKDYIVAANELLKKLPNIMPKIGELDYCIPGPNPSWEVISGDTNSAFADYAYSLSSEYKDGTFFKRDSTTYSIAGPGDIEYENYKNIFKGTMQSMWIGIQNSETWKNLNELGGFGTSVIQREGGIINGQISDLLTIISNNLRDFYTEYKTEINDIYGLLTKPFLEKENTGILTPNPDYLQMAEEGLNITKNIISYDEDINGAIEDYSDAIVQANSNIYKLDQIRSKVSEIIIAAQGRRDARLLEILKKETGEKCRQERISCLARTDLPIADIEEICGSLFGQCSQKTMTEAEYKTKYAACLEEEDILYMEDLEITNYDNEEGRCSDGLDNDRDELVDFKDPDCAGEITQCSDGTDNDRDRRIDKDDPSCHIDGDINKTYIPTHNSETTFLGETDSTHGTCIQNITTTTGPRGTTQNCGVFSNVNKALCEAHVYHHDETKSTTCKWVPSSGNENGSQGYCSISYEYSESPITENERTSCNTNETKISCENDYDIQIDTFSQTQRKYSCEWTSL